MTDCRTLANENIKLGPLKTCRFDTRIDYVFINEVVTRKWKLIKIETVDDNASDHNMVMATFGLNDVERCHEHERRCVLI